MPEPISSRPNPQHYPVDHEPVSSEGPEHAGDSDEPHDARRHPTLDEHVRARLHTPEEVSATRRPRPMEPFDPLEAVASAVVDDTLTEKAVGLVAPALGHGLAMMSQATVLFEYLREGAAYDIERGERENQIYHHDRYRGFIAGLEGRSGSPEARREAEEHLGYRDGLAAFELFLAQTPPAEVTHLLAHVDASRTAGMDAVLLGRDRGAAFERRYADDLVFHHAVDFERRERSRDPEAFAAKKERAEERAAQLEHGRRALVVRP